MISLGIRHLSTTEANGKKATRPCACGFLGHYSGRCRCTPDQILRYRSRMSGPLLDRIDIQIEVPAVPVKSLGRADIGESSSVIRERVERARTAMLERQEKPNAKLAAADIPQYCVLDDKGAAILQTAIAKLELSARAYHRILKVARTIADCASADEITASHVAEAIQYRRFDCQLQS